MSKIDDVRQLPKWAREPDRYYHYKDAPLFLIYEELKGRSCLLHYIAKDKMSDVEDLANFFVSEMAFTPVAKDDFGSQNQELVDAPSLEPLHVWAAAALGYNAHKASEGLQNQPIHKTTVGIPGELYLSIDLTASDREIMAELKSKLSVFREEAGYPNLKSGFNYKATLNKLASYGVYEELDLQIWEQLTGNTVSDAVRARVIRSGSFITNEIQEKTKPLAARSIERDFMAMINRELHIAQTDSYT